MDQHNSDDVKKHVRSIRIILGFFCVSGIVSFVMGLGQEGQIAIISYAGAILCLIFCLIGIWVLSLAKKKSAP
jgi:prolipoprotein diacylglyceryltransferase